MCVVRLSKSTSKEKQPTLFYEDYTQHLARSSPPCFFVKWQALRLTCCKPLVYDTLKGDSNRLLTLTTSSSSLSRASTFFEEEPMLASVQETKSSNKKVAFSRGWHAGVKTRKKKITRRKPTSQAIQAETKIRSVRAFLIRSFLPFAVRCLRGCATSFDERENNARSFITLDTRITLTGTPTFHPSLNLNLGPESDKPRDARAKKHRLVFRRGLID